MNEYMPPSQPGRASSLGRELSVLAASLDLTDHVVLESTAVSWAFADALAEHAGKVTASNPMKTTAIASAKVKTDKG
jgi:hypothetical protein